MKKIKKVALNLAFLTMLLSTGITSSYYPPLNLDSAYASESASSATSKGNSKFSAENQAKILNTFENGDYLALKKIMGENNKINNLVNESIFNSFTTARVAARNGQYSKALKITESIKKQVIA